MKCAGLLILVFTASCFAQEAVEAPSQEEILNLFKVMHVREQTLAVMQKSEAQIKAITHDLVQRRIPDITPLQLGELDEMIANLYDNYPVDQILGDMVPVYQKHLNKSDIEVVLAFYTSPVGQKLTRELPAMTEEAMQVASSRIQDDTEDVMRRLEERIQKMSTEQKQQRPAKPASPPNPK